jgi:hypothetical protein
VTSLGQRGAEAVADESVSSATTTVFTASRVAVLVTLLLSV